MVRSVRRAIELLQTLGEQGSMTVTELARRHSLPKTTVHDILKTLESLSIVVRDSGTSTFQLGWTLFELGQRAQDKSGLLRVARSSIERLNRVLDETVHLTVLDNGEVLYVDCVESTRRLRTYPVIGVRAPLHCTAVGKAMMAFLDDDQVDLIVDQYGLARFTDNTITTRETLSEELKRIQDLGFAVDDVEHEPGVRCVGAPIRNAGAEVFASISISGPTMRITRARIPELGRLLVETADGISRGLGYRDASIRRGNSPTHQAKRDRREMPVPEESSDPKEARL